MHYVNKTSMLNKLGHTLPFLFEKTAIVGSWIGHKVGNELIAISPFVPLFNPVNGAGVASAGRVLKGIGALGNARKALIARGTLAPRNPADDRWDKSGRRRCPDGLQRSSRGRQSAREREMTALTFFLYNMSNHSLP